MSDIEETEEERVLRELRARIDAGIARYKAEHPDEFRSVDDFDGDVRAFLDWLGSGEEGQKS